MSWLRNLLTRLFCRAKAAEPATDFEALRVAINKEIDRQEARDG